MLQGVTEFFDSPCILQTHASQSLTTNEDEIDSTFLSCTDRLPIIC